MSCTFADADVLASGPASAVKVAPTVSHHPGAGPTLKWRASVPQDTCEHCDRSARVRGWCTMHYQRWKKHGDALAPVKGDMTHQQYLAKNTDMSGGPDACWPWMANIGSGGYGQDRWGHGWLRAHRSVYEWLVGTIDAGKQLDHMCHNPETCHPVVASDCPHRKCVNPKHLQPVTQQVNISRGGGPQAQNARAKHCAEGHSLGPDGDVHYDAKRNTRTCRICRRAGERRRAREKAAA